MSDRAFVDAVIAKLREAGQDVLDSADRVSLSVEELATFLSRHNLDVVQQFVRLQRMAGVQTIHYASVEPDSFTWLTDRLGDFDLLLDKDKEEAKLMLQAQVVDIRPVVDQRLFQLCSRHLSLSDFGFLTD